MDGVNQSALEGGEGEGMAEHWAAGRGLCAVKYGGTEAEGCYRYKIGYADLNNGIDERGFSCRARLKPGYK